MKLTPLMARLLLAFGQPKKDANAPPPDPNIGKAQDRLASLAERQQDWYESTIAPALMDQLRQNTDISKRVADSNLAAQDFQTGLAKKYDERYWNTQVPLEDQLISVAQKYNEPAEREAMAGQAGADVEQASAIGKQNLQQGLRLRGINLGSGAAVSAMADQENAATLAKAGAMNKTREVARQMGFQRLGDAAALGRGLPGFSAGSTSLALGAGAGAVNAGAAGQSSVAGVGASGMNNTNTQAGIWGNVGGLGVQKYQVDSANWQNAQNNDPMNAILGAAAGVASKWAIGAIAGSDRRLKTDIVPVGKLNSGLTVYLYRYKGGSKFQLGVMADEVEKVIPEAVVKNAIDGRFDAVDYSKVH
jgi:hypothetical protein